MFLQSPCRSLIFSIYSTTVLNGCWFFTMDILQELPLELLPILQEKLKPKWPLNAPGYYALASTLSYPKIREEFEFKVFCPHGDMNYGFVGIRFKGIQEIIIFSFTEDSSKLEEALVTTKRINWNSKVRIDIGTSQTVKIVERIRDVLGLTQYFIGIADMYFLKQNTKPFSDLRLPADTYAAPVKQEHLHRVDETWPYKHFTSHSYFSILASNGLSYGLYSHNHELLAWVFISDYNFLCHLYCEEAHRRKGLAEYVLKWAVNEQLRQRNDLYAYVIEGNEKPVSLLKKVGFQVVGNGAYMFVQK